MSGGWGVVCKVKGSVQSCFLKSARFFQAHGFGYRVQDTIQRAQNVSSKIWHVLINTAAPI